MVNVDQSRPALSNVDAAVSCLNKDFTPVAKTISKHISVMDAWVGKAIDDTDLLQYKNVLIAKEKAASADRDVQPPTSADRDVPAAKTNAMPKILTQPQTRRSGQNVRNEKSGYTEEKAKAKEDNERQKESEAARGDFKKKNDDLIQQIWRQAGEVDRETARLQRAHCQGC